MLDKSVLYLSASLGIEAEISRSKVPTRMVYEPGHHCQELEDRNAKKEKEMERLMRFLKNKGGVTAIEYALAAALIALVIIVAVVLVGTTLSGTFQNVGSHVAVGG